MTRNIFALPVSKGDIDNAYLRPHATSPVHGSHRDPDLVTSPGMIDLVINLDLNAVVQDHPQLGSTGMGLETTALSGLKMNKRNGDFLIVSILLHPSPGALNPRCFWFG